MNTNIYDFVTESVAGFLRPIEIAEGWSWSFKDFIRKSFLYKNSQFERENDNRDKRPFKNIIRPILNIQYRTEGFDVKDIELFVNSAKSYYKSFLVKKFHEKWAVENGMDTFIDELVESYVDYGGTLVKKTMDARPEVVDLQSLAFCDQTNILSGTFAIKHFFSPQELRDMGTSGWGDKTKGATMDLETLIKLARPEKKKDYGTKSDTPSKYIEVFEVHGIFKNAWLKGEDETYTPQVHIIAFYKGDANDVGVTLFSVKEPKLPFKFLARDKIYGRALGFGGVEELFEPQVWANYSEIQIREMLELAGKTLFKSTDPSFKTKNKIVDMENGQILDLKQGTDIGQLDTTPRNLVIFANAVERWEQHALRMGAAGESLMGESPSAGTPFKLQELVVGEAKSLHKWRQGKIAVFVDEIYRDWILPHIASEITKGQEFLAELTADELQSVSDSVSNNLANQMAIERILNGQLVSQEEIMATKIQSRDVFLRGGNERFIEILKDEMKGEKLDVSTNIAGKQKNLSLLTDKIVNVLRQFIATPEIRQDPGMIKLLNTILESSGMSPVMFGTMGATPIQPSQATQPLQQLSKLNQPAT